MAQENGASDASTEDELQIYATFDAMNLPETLWRGVCNFGFEKPSAIQQKAIVPLSKGRDVIGQAQSGTGKTGAFVIGSLARLDPLRRGIQILILSPTHELAKQTHKVASAMSYKMTVVGEERGFRREGMGRGGEERNGSGSGGSGGSASEVKTMPVRCHLCIGGTSVNDDVKALRDYCPSVVCGTPGRIFDMIRRKALDTREIRVLIVDEADEMLSKGFIDQLYDIVKEVPSNAQIGLFSATLPQEVLQLTEKFMHNPLKILMQSEALTLQGITQFHIAVDEEDWKFDILVDLHETLSLKQTIIYVNLKRKCEWLAKKMRHAGYAVGEIHANLSPQERDAVMADFISGTTRVLMSTDLLARGIDIQQVSMIVNYDLPTTIENYIHRIGRSGRYGRKGLAINLVHGGDMAKLKQICQYYATDIPEMPKDIERYL